MIGTFTAVGGAVRIMHVLVRYEFVPHEFKIRAVLGNNLALTHQTLFPTNHISLLLQYLLVSGSKTTQPLSREMSEIAWI